MLCLWSLSENPRWVICSRWICCAFRIQMVTDTMIEPKKKRAFMCTCLPSAILLSAVFFIGSVFLVTDYKEVLCVLWFLELPSFYIYWWYFPPCGFNYDLSISFCAVCSAKPRCYMIVHFEARKIPLLVGSNLYTLWF